MATESDRLAARHRAGDPTAKREVARYLLPVLPGWLRQSFSRLTPEDVEDLTILCAAHIIARLDKFEGRSSFDTWARRVIRNRVLDWLNTAQQRARRMTTSIDKLVQGPDGKTTALIDMLPSNGPGPDSQAARDQQRELVRLAIERLRNPRHRWILTERVLNDRGIGEIAEERREKRSKYDMLLYHAKEALFRELERLGMEQAS